MAKLSTKDIKSGVSVQKTLQPGNTVIRIDNVALKAVSFKEGAYDIILKAEGEPLGDSFEGFYISKEDPSLGRHLGQVGTIRATEWYFVDGETKSKIPVSRDTEIMKWVQNVCKQMGAKDWFDSQDDKHDTIEQLITAFNDSGPLKGKWVYTCLCGKEYTNREGYTNYDLFLPKFTQKGVPLEPKGTKPTWVTMFDEIYHIKKGKKAESLEGGFDGGSKRKGTESPFEI